MGIDKRMVYFLRNNITETERKNAVAAGADMSKYDASGNEERIKKAYENRDRSPSIIKIPLSEQQNNLSSYW